MQPHDRAAHGELPAEPITIRQHGVDFRVDLREGQKTGFYLDQRENRRVAADLFPGRRVLDVCCYTGAFGLIAARHGAADVTCIDASAKAIEAARANAELNGIGNVGFEVGDCFDVLEAMAKRGEQFGAIVLDPPRFAGSRSAVERALSAYNRLNSLAVRMLEPAGWLVTCSCSAHVTREDFQDMVATVSAKTGRDIQLVQQRGASPDHPVSATCEETEYLKCFVCRVL
jgi:23S rRNA (cytosine1962-C5)-methyltransferase